MPPNYHVGQRISFESALCTVLYYGPVEGTDKTWLGVEWDDPTRGKHDGESHGVRYFKCKSRSSTAASFVRPNRKADPEQSFVEAVHQKYAKDTNTQPNTASSDNQIEISGKVVEEIGFEKIRQQLAQLHKLRIVLVDGLRISIAEKPDKAVKDVCPQIVELDLSRNLFETCKEIIHICGELDNLRSLRINGNRLQVLPEELATARHAFEGVKELEMDKMLLSWGDLCKVAEQFESLLTLTASSNGFRSLSSPFCNSTLTSLTLEYNEFTSISDLSPLSQLASLETLLLKGNQISRISADGMTEKPVFGGTLRYVDISYNAVLTWSFVDDLAHTFPGLRALRFSKNPIYESIAKESGSEKSVEDTYMLTLARLGSLNSLNFSNISKAERTNAEMFYLSRIGKAMAEVPESQEHIITSQHKRFAELCEIYGAPTVVRKETEAVNTDFLEARLIKFTFYMPPETRAGQEETITKRREIPKGFDIYRVKGLVGRMFGVRPLCLRLIWETGEWDPVAGYEEQEEDSSDDEGGKENSMHAEPAARGDKGKWMKREVEIENSTRQVGFCVDGMEATVRVEIR